MKMTRKAGGLLLGAWLVLQALISLLDLSFRGSGTVLALLALASGVLILIDR